MRISDWSSDVCSSDLDVQQACRSIAAKECSLRSAQHLDPFYFTQFVQSHASARAVDAVDEHSDRAFQARIIADRAYSANTGRAIGQIGRASCRERGCTYGKISGVALSLKKKKKKI